MKTCDVCGEEIAPGSAVCPFCETAQPPDPSGRADGPPVRDLDVEAGLPTVAEALRRLEAQLDRARAEGVRVVRVIHGWGSAAGGGGKIRAAARQWLQGQLERGRIRSYLPGDRYARALPEGRDFLRRHPALRPAENSDRNNPGITFVEP